MSDARREARGVELAAFVPDLAKALFDSYRRPGPK
jgi:hypothetical protein